MHLHQLFGFYLEQEQLLSDAAADSPPYLLFSSLHFTLLLRNPPIHCSLLRSDDSSSDADSRQLGRQADEQKDT